LSDSSWVGRGFRRVVEKIKTDTVY